MSLRAIKQYQLEVEKIIQFGDTKKKTAIWNAFYSRLNEYTQLLQKNVTPIHFADY